MNGSFRIWCNCDGAGIDKDETLVSNQIQVERIALPSRSEDWKDVLVDTEALEQSVLTLADMERQLSKLTKDARPTPATSRVTDWLSV